MVLIRKPLFIVGRSLEKDLVRLHRESQQKQVLLRARRNQSHTLRFKMRSSWDMRAPIVRYDKTVDAASFTCHQAVQHNMHGQSNEMVIGPGGRGKGLTR